MTCLTPGSRFPAPRTRWRYCSCHTVPAPHYRARTLDSCAYALPLPVLRITVVTDTTCRTLYRVGVTLTCGLATAWLFTYTYPVTYTCNPALHYYGCRTPATRAHTPYHTLPYTALHPLPGRRCHLPHGLPGLGSRTVYCPVRAVGHYPFNVHPPITLARTPPTTAHAVTHYLYALVYTRTRGCVPFFNMTACLRLPSPPPLPYYAVLPPKTAVYAAFAVRVLPAARICPHLDVCGLHAHCGTTAHTWI